MFIVILGSIVLMTGKVPSHCAVGLVFNTKIISDINIKVTECIGCLETYRHRIQNGPTAKHPV